MVSTLVITIPSGAKALVVRGDKVDVGFALAKSKESRQLAPVSLANLLGIPKKKIISYLTKSIGASVKQGEIIAKRKKLFTEFLVRSPVDAVISSIDLTTGMLNLVASSIPTAIKSPVTGRVKKVTENAIEVDFEGKVVSGIRGYGWASGTLVYLDKAKHTVLGDFSDGKPSVNQNIIATSHLNDILVSKLRAMGAVGLVSANYTNSSILPYIIVAQDELTTLSSYHGRQAVLYGEQSYLVIAD